MKEISNIIKALGEHEDAEAIKVLEEVGTNSPNDEIRAMSAKALIKRNEHDSLKIMIIEKGKGIHDLSSSVSMTAINEILKLKDKTEVIKILEDTINLHSDKEVKETARSVRTLITYSK